MKQFILPALCAVALLNSSCANNRPGTGSETNQYALTDPQKISYLIYQVETLPNDIGGVYLDHDAKKILTFKKRAAQFLIEKLNNETLSRHINLFQYTISDVAHFLLCEIYQKPFLWPVEKYSPDERTARIQDYLTFVRAPGGRQFLKNMWENLVRKDNLREQ